MGKKKPKPPTLRRFHEMSADEIVVNGQKAVRSSQERIKKSKIIKESTRKMIDKIRQRKKK